MRHVESKAARSCEWPVSGRAANSSERPTTETETLQDGEKIKARLDLEGQHIGEDAREQVENSDSEQGTDERADQAHAPGLDQVDQDGLTGRGTETAEHGDSGQLLPRIGVDSAGHTHAAEQQGDKAAEV